MISIQSPPMLGLPFISCYYEENMSSVSEQSIDLLLTRYHHFIVRTWILLDAFDVRCNLTTIASPSNYSSCCTFLHCHSVTIMTKTLMLKACLHYWLKVTLPNVALHISNSYNDDQTNISGWTIKISLVIDLGCIRFGKTLGSSDWLAFVH